MGRILQMHSNHRKDLEECYCGDIAAAVGLKNTTTGDTLCDPKHPIILESMEFPDPVIRVAIEPKTKAGQEKMGIALAKLAEEDPTFRTYTDEETGQTIIAGMGELHLEIIVDRLLREFKASKRMLVSRRLLTKKPFAKWLMLTINTLVRVVVKVSTVMLRSKLSRTSPVKDMSLSTRSSVVRFRRNTFRLLTLVFRAQCSPGVLAGYPVVDCKVTLYDGSYHEVDSSEMAFKIAGSMAFKEAMRKGDPVILEPIMKVTVIVPEEYMGDVIGDLNSRRGQIQAWKLVRVHSRSMRLFRCLRCSVTQPISVPKHRAVASMLWNRAIMLKYRNRLRKALCPAVQKRTIRS